MSNNKRDRSSRNDIYFVIPVHLNPNVKSNIESMLSEIKNVILLPPLNYPDFIWFMKESYLILTDSGGVEEEGPHFKKPILVLRDTTERLEGIKYGTNVLISSNPILIKSTLTYLLEKSELYNKFKSTISPYGEIDAAGRVFNFLNK